MPIGFVIMLNETTFSEYQVIPEVYKEAFIDDRDIYIISSKGYRYKIELVTPDKGLWYLTGPRWTGFCNRSVNVDVSLMHFVEEGDDCFYVTGHNRDGIEVGGYGGNSIEILFSLQTLSADLLPNLNEFDEIKISMNGMMFMCNVRREEVMSSGEYSAGSLGETQPPAPPSQEALWIPNMQGDQRSFATGPCQTFRGLRFIRPPSCMWRIMYLLFIVESMSPTISASTSEALVAVTKHSPATRNCATNGLIVSSMSCLKINLHKSKLMGIGVSSNVVAAAASLIGCSILTAPFNYLGVKLKLLSIGGRLSLLKSVLTSIPLYHMSIFKVPTGVLNHLECIRWNFFYGVDGSDRKLALIGWNIVLTSKKNSGLGVSSFFAHNRALLFKWIWRFLTDDSSLWTRFIKAIFGNKGALDTHKLIPRRSPWQDVILAIHSLQ
nr:RNA-directed DNA polymerase, eukaryota, reverse transcriptase zinc-binding domain protein [Tanacetum cinerariifolium]